MWGIPVEGKADVQQLHHAPEDRQHILRPRHASQPSGLPREPQRQQHKVQHWHQQIHSVLPCRKGPVPPSVSQSVDYIFSSQQGLIRCLTLIVTVSTQHHSPNIPREHGYIHKINLPKKNRVPDDVMTGTRGHLVVPDQAVLAMQVMLVQRDPVRDETDGPRSRAREYQGCVLVECCLLHGCRVVTGRPAGVVGEGNVCLCRLHNILVILQVSKNAHTHSVSAATPWGLFT